jgi:HAE1 family hydrophobic/amphiphilic exporter-1
MASGTTPEDEQQVANVLREQLERTGLARFEFERPTYFSFRTPIEVEVYSDSLPELYEASAAVRERLERIPGIVDIQSSAELGNPELQIHFDRNQLAQLGLNLGDVADTVRNKVQGEVATRFTEGDREIDIVVRSVELGRASVSDVEDFIIGQRDGIPIFLKSVAEVQLADGPSEIRRIGQKRTGVISGNLEGRDMGSAAEEVRAALADIALPGGVTATLSGQEEERAEAQKSLLMAMALAIFLVYLVMASQFESFVHPFVIIFSLPLGAIGVIGALGMTGRSINVVAMIGAVMLAGIVVNNAIVLVDAINQRRRSGMDRVEALLAAGSDRLRPILMTSATTILGLAPMAMGLGEGAELRAPLAITVIGGLTVATLLTLLVIPVVYSLVDRREKAVDRTADRARKARETNGISLGALGESG